MCAELPYVIALILFTVVAVNEIAAHFPWSAECEKHDLYWPKHINRPRVLPEGDWQKAHRKFEAALAELSDGARRKDGTSG